LLVDPRALLVFEKDMGIIGDKFSVKALFEIRRSDPSLSFLPRREKERANSLLLPPSPRLRRVTGSITVGPQPVSLKPSPPFSSKMGRKNNKLERLEIGDG